MNDRPTSETDALECAFALLKCSPIGSTENSSEYGRAAYRLSKHCQGKEDVSEAAMRIFAERIAELERERDEAREQANVMHEQWLSKGRCCGNLAEELHEVKQQRDKAIARSKEWSDWCVQYMTERDEARRESALDFPALRNELLRVYKECDQLKVERDEAVARAHNFEQGYHIHSARADEAARHRDEARDFLRNESTRADAYMDGMDRARRECANLEEIIRGEWPEDQAEELIRNAKEAAK